MHQVYTLLEKTNHIFSIRSGCAWPTGRNWIIENDYSNFYKNLNKILSDEFIESKIGFIYDRLMPPIRAKIVVSFETEEDCLIFVIKYGHIYGS